MGRLLECEKIKLIIWDLDETVWDGILAERDTVKVYPEVKRIIKQLSYQGIINSVCSQNDYQTAKEVLIKNELWDYIVFASINFEPKGERVRDIINSMNLREENVLYMDDNYLMLQEVRYYCPKINVLLSYNVDKMMEEESLKGSKDFGLRRLHRYKQMEKRYAAGRKEKSNLAFMESIHVKVKLIDYEPYLLMRITELVERTNQLNYTKNRMGRDELQKLLKDPKIECKCVWVKDDFCDNGIVGFYVKMKNELIHFVFSCRILNMGIDQWVYTKIGDPELRVVGEVAGQLKKGIPLVPYISEIADYNDMLNEKLFFQHYISEREKMRIYALGACDMYRMIGNLTTYNTDMTFDCNVFQGQNRSVNVGTEYIRSSYEMNSEEKEFCRKYFSNYSGKLAFNCRLWEREYDYAVFTFHDDFVYLIYEHKRKKGLRIIRDKECIFDAEGNIMSPKNEKRWLEENFDPPHLITPERFFDNLRWIRKHLPEHTKMILVNGPTLDFYYSNDEHNEVLHRQIITLNQVIREFTSDEANNAKCVDVNKYIKSRLDVWDYLFHWMTETSFKITHEIFEVMAEFKNCRENYRVADAPFKGRSILLIGDDQFTSLSRYALLANGYDVEGILSPAQLQEKGRNAIDQYGGEAKYRFLFITDSGNSFGIMEKLQAFGYSEIKDYLLFQSSDYVNNWNSRN